MALESLVNKTISKTKKSLKSLACATLIGASLIGGLRETKAETILNYNSVVDNNIEYYMQTDKSVYNLGEEVSMLYKVTNLGSEDVGIHCSQRPVLNILVQKDDETIWSLYYGFIYNMAIVKLSAGESKGVPYDWDMKDYKGFLVKPGVYNTVGIMYNYQWNYELHGTYTPTEVGVLITIIPEPSSLVLFLTGLASLTALHYFNKKERVKYT